MVMRRGYGDEEEFFFPAEKITKSIQIVDVDFSMVRFALFRQLFHPLLLDLM